MFLIISVKPREIKFSTRMSIKGENLTNLLNISEISKFYLFVSLVFLSLLCHLVLSRF